MDGSRLYYVGRPVGRPTELFPNGELSVDASSGDLFSVGCKRESIGLVIGAVVGLGSLGGFDVPKL